MTGEPERILVIGIGNPLMGDEGVGVRVVEQLMAGYTFPDNVEVMDAGTMGYSMLDLFRDIERLVVIDAVDGTGHDPGTVVVLTPDQIAPNSIMHSLHDTRLVDVLQAASLMGLEPEAVCIGIQIDHIEQWTLELTPAVADAVPIAAAATLGTLRDVGIEPSPGSDPSVQAAIIAALRSYAPMPTTNATASSAEDLSD